MRQPGIEPGSTAWKAAMLTIIPLTLLKITCQNNKIYFSMRLGCVILTLFVPRIYAIISGFYA